MKLESIIEKEELQKDRDKLRQYTKKEIKDVFYKIIDNAHINFLCEEENTNLDIDAINIIRNFVDYIKESF